MVRPALFAMLVAAVLAGGIATAQTRVGDEAKALALAKREAEQAELRSRQCDFAGREGTGTFHAKRS